MSTFILDPLEISKLLGKKCSFSKAVKERKEKEKLCKTAAHLNFMRFEFDDHTDEISKCYFDIKVDEEYARGSWDLFYMYYEDGRCHYISEFVKEIYQKYISGSSELCHRFRRARD